MNRECHLIGWDSSLGKASGFRPQGPGFQSASAIVLEVTLGCHSSNNLTIPRYKIGTRPTPGNSELTLRTIIHKSEQSAGDTFETHG